jgi:hypothetical protein
MKKLWIVFLTSTMAVAQSADKKADHQHYADVQKRGEAHQGMGFSQSETTHHFILTSTGGIIQVTANDPNDRASIEQVQMHFRHIAKLFADGNFDIPHFVHDQTPPGVATMQKLKSKITFTNETLDNGAKLVITTRSPQALTAVHDFLRFQIKDHQTGDPLTISKENEPGL